MAAKKKTTKKSAPKKLKKDLEMTPLMILSVVAFFLIAFILMTQSSNKKTNKYVEANVQPKKVIVVSDEDLEDNGENEMMEVMEK